MKRTITLLLVAAMILSSASTAFADTNNIKFTDINSSWAKQYIINVYNKGLMNGSSQTEFKPLLNVTNYQVLITIARMAKAQDKYNLTALAEKYKNNLVNVPSYKGEIAYCLETGVVTAQELNAMSQYTQATKQVTSRFLAKALGASYDPNKAIVFLGFTDAEFILKENKPYIKHLIDLGVLSSAGDAKGNFNPDSVVTREMFAKMLDIASDKYAGTNSSIPSTPTTPVTPPVTTTPITPSTTETPDYTGAVDQVIIEYGVMVFQIKGVNNVMTKKDFKVTDDIKCIIDGVESSSYWKVKNGDKAQIYINRDGKIYKLVIDSKIKKLSGTIENILITDKLELNIKLQSGEIKTYYITDKTRIIKNKTIVRYDYLKPGDKIAITVDDDNVTDINADSTIMNDTGIIESIIYTRTAAPRITMFDSQGNKKEYFIRKDLDSKNIIIAGRYAYVYDLRPGMNIQVDLENDEIIKLTTIKTETTEKFDGTIKYINMNLKIIVITQYDNVQQKEIERNVYVGNCEIANIRLERLSLQQLKPGDKVTIFGVNEIDRINASSILVNN
jgi:hypothetical protein